MVKSIRQCISCRTRKSKKELLRVVRNLSGDVEFDPQQKQMGRGLYLCFQAACVEKAKANNLIQKRFHVDVRQSVYLEIAEYIQKFQNSSCEMLLGFAARSRSLIFGMTAIKDGIRKGKVSMVIIDQLANPTMRQRMESLSRKMKIPLMFYSEKNPFDKIVGKANCRCAGVTDSRFVDSLKKISPS